MIELWKDRTEIRLDEAQRSRHAENGMGTVPSFVIIDGDSINVCFRLDHQWSPTSSVMPCMKPSQWGNESSLAELSYKSVHYYCTLWIAKETLRLQAFDLWSCSIPIVQVKSGLTGSQKMKVMIVYSIFVAVSCFSWVSRCLRSWSSGHICLG